MSSPEYIKVIMTAKLSMTVPVKTYQNTRDRSMRAKFQVPWHPDTPKLQVRSKSFVVKPGRKPSSPVLAKVSRSPQQDRQGIPPRSRSYSPRPSRQEQNDQCSERSRSLTQDRGRVPDRGRSRSQAEIDGRSVSSPGPVTLSRRLEPARTEGIYDGSQDQGLGGNQTEFGCGSHDPRSW